MARPRNFDRFLKALNRELGYLGQESTDETTARTYHDARWGVVNAAREIVDQRADVPATWDDLRARYNARLAELDCA